MIGFSGIFLVMLLIYVFIRFIPAVDLSTAEYGMDFLLPRLAYTAGGVVICLLLVYKGWRMISDSD